MAKIKAKVLAKPEKKVKAKRIKRDISDNEKEVYRFVAIFLVVVLVVLGFYFISKKVVKDRDNNETTNSSEKVTISYDTVNVGMILNRPYDEYFVMVYDGSLSEAIYYSSLITKYKNNESALKIYYCDLSDKLNKDYTSGKDTGNSSAQKTSDFSFGKVTLLKIRNGKIVSYIEELDKIKNILN